jgi:hypothetical protein
MKWISGAEITMTVMKKQCTLVVGRGPRFRATVWTDIWGTMGPLAWRGGDIYTGTSNSVEPHTLPDITQVVNGVGMMKVQVKR